MCNRSHLNTVLALIGLAHSPFDARRSMKVNSPIFNEISGKLGGAVGITSRFGMQLRGLVTGSNPDTGFQFIVRNILASLASKFRNTLSETERNGWETLADDTPGAASGLTLFVRANSERRHANTAPIGPVALADVDTAPISSGADFNILPDTIVVDASDKTLAFHLGAVTDPWTAAGGAMNVYLSRQQRASRNTRIHPFTLIGSIDGTDVATGEQTFDLTVDAIASIYASMVAGEVCYVKFTTMAPDGGRSRDYATRIVIQA